MSYLHWQDISYYLSKIDQEKGEFEKTGISPEAIESTRKKITHYLDQLKLSLEQKVGKEHTALILFATVAGVDEEMQSFDYNHLKVRWTPLQKDFYSAYTAGEVFFKTIDEILDDPLIPSIVYEVFYFMLKRGFQGKYRDSKTQLHKYLDLLRQKIAVVTPSSQINSAEPIVSYAKNEKKKKWHYYSAAFAGIAIIFFGLFIFSNIE